MASTESYSSGTPRVRRLSNVSATREDMVNGPNVVVPPKHLMASTAAYEAAKAMGVAKYHLEEENSSAEITPRAVSPVTGVPVVATDRYAFAFDIDGVLIRGGKPIP